MDPNWIIAIGTVVLAIVAWRQLNKLNKTLKINSLMAVLELESEMSRKKEKHEDAVGSLRKKEQMLSEDTDDTTMSGFVEIAKYEVKSSLENYLFSLNRLCFCINSGHISNKDWKSEYRELIFKVVDNHEGYFNAASKYPSIIDIKDKWKRE